MYINKTVKYFFIFIIHLFNCWHNNLYYRFISWTYSY